MPVEVKFTESIVARAIKDTRAARGGLAVVITGFFVAAYPISRAIPDNGWFSFAKEAWPVGAFVSTAYLLSVFLFCLVRAPFSQRSEAREELERTNQSAPRIQLGDPSISSTSVAMRELWPDGSERVYYPIFFQALFVNSPVKGGTTESAKGVSARIRFESSVREPLTLWGRWSHLSEPLQAGAKDFDPAINCCDIEPNNFPVKLDVAIWHPNTTFAYAYNNASLMPGVSRLGGNPDFLLPPGEHRIRIDLSGQRVSQTFWLQLRVPGDNQRPILSVASPPQGTEERTGT